MSQYDSKRVKFAAVAASIHVPGIGSLKQTLTSYHDGLNIGYDMTLCEPFLKVETKDKVNKPITILIPITYLTHLVLEAE